MSGKGADYKRPHQRPFLYHVALVDIDIIYGQYIISKYFVIQFDFFKPILLKMVRETIVMNSL